MRQPIAQLRCWSLDSHLSQIYTGLAMLDRQRHIRLEQTVLKPAAPRADTVGRAHLRHAKATHCEVELGGLLYYIDVHDGDEIDQEGFARCDVYLKRGYNPVKQRDLKVRPLGLNYQVHADGLDAFEFVRRLKIKGPASAAKYLLVQRRMTVSAFESPPSANEPSVLFLCRAWEVEPGRDADKNAERNAINELRYECIIALRKEFSGRCIAGFAPTPYACEHFASAVVTEQCLVEQRRYLKLVRSTPICVATMGLHQSNGWKLGEYVASSRAIVSETLRHTVPEFLADKHYLEFRRVTECVDKVGTLMDDKSMRGEMAEANRDYYFRRLRPDRLMTHALGLRDDAR